MVLGLSPRDSGVRLNGDETGPPGLDSVLASAWSAGVFVRVRSRGYKPFESLVRPPEGADVVGGRWAFAADRAIARALPAPSSDGARAIETWWVHLGEVDDAGHLCGSACAPYAEAARDAAETVRATAAVLDPSRDLLLVVSDHGMREEGGHGGNEPELDHAFLLAWGARVRPGVDLEPRPLRDFAPTAAVAMGVAPPSSSLGAPMLDIWDLSEAEAATAMQVPFEQAATYACTLAPHPRCETVEATRASLARGEGADVADRILHTIAGDREAAAEQAEARARGIRGGIGAVLATAALVFTRFRLRDAWPRAAGGLLSPLPAALGYAAVLGAHGYRPTLSSMAAESVFVPHALQAAAAGAVCFAIVGRFAAWSRREATFAVFVVTLGFVMVAALAGADPRSVLSPLFGCLVVQVAPLVGATALGGIAIAARSKA